MIFDINNKKPIPIKGVFSNQILSYMIEHDFINSISLDYKLWYYHKFFYSKTNINTNINTNTKPYAEFAHIRANGYYSGAFFSASLFDIIISETLPYKGFCKNLYCVIINITDENVETRDFLSLEEAKDFSKLYLELI